MISLLKSNATEKSRICPVIQKFKITAGQWSMSQVHKDEFTFFFSNVNFLSVKIKTALSRGFSLARLLMFTQSFAWLVC